MRSVKLCFFLFSADGPHSLVVKGTHSQARTATAVVRPSPESHAKQQSSATVAIILIPLLTCIDKSVENSMERIDTSKWRGDGTHARVTSPQPITNERFFLPQSSV